MDASIWVCCSIIGAFISYYLIFLFFSNVSPKAVSILRKYMFQPQIRRQLRLGSFQGRRFSVNIRGTGVVTPLYVVLAIIVLILNIVVLAISAKNQNLLIWRSGRVLAFNLCILIVSGRQSLFSDSLGIAYKFQTFFHRWLGRVVFLVGIVHVVIAFVPYQNGIVLSPRSRIAGFTVCRPFIWRSKSLMTMDSGCFGILCSYTILVLFCSSDVL
jgi:Ferric reductase like transmembrane component